jgi:hypothetical protein
MPRKVNKAKDCIYGVQERRRILPLNRSNALIAAAILAHAERQLLPVNRIDQEPDTALITIAIPTGWPVVFCVSILLLYTAFSLAHVFYNNINMKYIVLLFPLPYTRQLKAVRCKI